ncbi:MAG: bifunctional riboflavin kinase/FAD synthetase [Desulfobacterales bacterium]|nr:bifunctional riboflavin kinase/FAD synthetase [Desulfobacterales bacterium]
MILYNNYDDIDKPFNNAVITIGNFDGVHKGHKELLKRTIEHADKNGGSSVAVTFDPHPIRVIKKNGDPPLITLNDQKIELIEAVGIDALVIIQFTSDFANLSSEDFIKKIMIDKIGMKTIIVGNDYSFGKNREGDINKLKELSVKYDFEMIVPDWVDIGNDWNERVSSTKVRELITDGKVHLAPKLLDRYYQIRGKVEKGRNRGGKLLGFPTANIKLHDELCPLKGVYAVTVECESGNFNGVANIGYSPTFDDHIFTVEVHLLDFDSDLYNKRIRVNFIERLRAEIKFSSIDDLIEQINKDIGLARKIFENI